MTNLIIDDRFEPALEELARRLRNYVDCVGVQRLGLTADREAPVDQVLQSPLRCSDAEPTHDRRLSQWLDGLRRRIRR